MIKNSEIVESVQEDVTNILVNYPNHDEKLLLTLLESDIPWLIDYVRNVENFIQLTDRPEAEGKLVSYMSGYFDAVRDLKRMVNEE